MSWKDKLVLSTLIWVCVYPGVLGVTFLFQWLGLGLALWLELLISTAITVPLISIVAAPRVEKVVAFLRHETLAELKVDQARAAPGPSPEEIVARRG